MNPAPPPEVDHPAEGAADRAVELIGAAAHRDEPLGPLTTYRVGGPAAVLVRAGDPADLLRVAEAAHETGLPVVAIGRGSNLLVADAGFEGIAVQLGEGFDTVAIDGTQVRAGGAVALPVLARRTVASGLAGFEWAVGVPGSVGGAVHMNAGGHGSDMARSLRRVRVVDLRTGQDGEVDAADLELRYRHSSLRPSQVVVWADLHLDEGDRAEGERLLAEIVRWRRAHQPGGANAGSVFANPEGDSAGRLIERAGAKGLRVGGATVSSKHANFIQADPEADPPVRAADILAVMIRVTDLVRASAGVTLIPETRLLGFGAEELPPAWISTNPQLSIEG